MVHNFEKTMNGMGAYKKYVRPEGGGGGSTKSEQKRTRGGGGGGLSPLCTFAFQKIVWPTLFTLAIISSLIYTLFLPSYKLLAFCLVPYAPYRKN